MVSRAALLIELQICHHPDRRPSCPATALHHWHLPPPHPSAPAQILQTRRPPPRRQRGCAPQRQAGRSLVSVLGMEEGGLGASEKKIKKWGKKKRKVQNE